MVLKKSTNNIRIFGIPFSLHDTAAIFSFPTRSKIWACTSSSIFEHHCYWRGILGLFRTRFEKKSANNNLLIFRSWGSNFIFNIKLGN
jgi:hypothetical protein